ncbi:MAG: hypothetical protein JXQ75_19190 [Phycisphaerae bacterium]|nr:hypothetical protein [Phycisphaerae bacterium]
MNARRAVGTDRKWFRGSGITVFGFRGFRFRDFGFRLPAFILLILPLVVCFCGSLQGCSAQARPDPMEVFDELRGRSLSGDVEFVRGRISPVLVKADAGAAKAGQGRVVSDELAGDVMREVAECRALSCEETKEGNRVVMEVARRAGSVVRRYRIDMVWDKEHGWRLASRLYDERPLKQRMKDEG